MTSSKNSKKSLDTSGHGDIHEYTEDLTDKNGRETNGQAQVPSKLIPESTMAPEKKKGAENVEHASAVNKEKSMIQNSWETVMKKVDILDDDLVRGYKEDIDTLLVFAGLFSAVVTAFTIESYKWLQEDSADTTNMLLNSTVVLLTQIAQQSGNNQSPPLSPPSHFTPSSSVVRINTFWFLSLTLSLTDALFGLLCKQWLREHQRQTNTHTPGQALALHWLRHQSFEEWHVPKILASLPILLEIALFLFFAGLLELLWTRHPVPFAIALAAVGLAAFLYLTTTILPGFSIIGQVLQIHPDLAFGFAFDASRIPDLPAINLICPYKSPQSWLIFHLLSAMYHLPGFKNLLHSVMAKVIPSWKYLPHILNDLITNNILNLSSWASLDLNIIQQFSSIAECPDLYELKGLRWLVQETRDTPSMIPHLKNVLAELPPHLVMPTVFGWWESSVVFDLESALQTSYRNTNDFFDDHSSAHDLGLISQIVAFRHFLATSNDGMKVPLLICAAEKLWNHILQEPINNQFTQALFCPEELLLCPSTASEYGMVLDFYMQNWDEVEVASQINLVERLTKAILHFLRESSDHDIKSKLLTTTHGLNFFNFVNNKLCALGNTITLPFYTKEWVVLLSHLRRICQLQPLYFKPIRGHFPIPHHELEGLLSNSTSESILEPLLDSFKQCWDDVEFTSYNKELVKMLTRHINNTVLTQVPVGFDPTSTNKESSLPTFTIIQSLQYLDFLTFINEKFIEKATSLDLCYGEAVYDWVDALEDIRVFCRLPSGYFKPIPKFGTVSGEVVGSYMPKNRNMGRIKSRAETTGRQDSDSDPETNEHGYPEKERTTSSSTGERSGMDIGLEDIKTPTGDVEVEQPNARILGKKWETEGQDMGQRTHTVTDGSGNVGGPGAEDNV